MLYAETQTRAYAGVRVSGSKCRLSGASATFSAVRYACRLISTLLIMAQLCGARPEAEHGTSNDSGLPRATAHPARRPAAGAALPTNGNHVPDGTG